MHTPLQGIAARQAEPLHKGIGYQHWHTVRAWINIRPDEKIYIERAEDFDRITPSGATGNQIKFRSHPISLNSKEVVVALTNAFDLFERHPGRPVSYRLTTNAGPREEVGSPFGPGKMGFDVWKMAPHSQDAQEHIINFLRSLKHLPPKVRDYITNTPASVVWSDFLSRISFDLNDSSYHELQEKVAADLVERGRSDHVPSYVARQFAHRLFSTVANKAARLNSAPLTKNEFEELWEEDAKDVRISRAALGKIQHGVSDPVLFQPLMHWLADRESALTSSFPRWDLFHKGIAYFLPEEELLISRVEKILREEGDQRIVSLTGNPAMGKTVIGAAIGWNLSLAGTECYYLSVNRDASPTNVISEMSLLRDIGAVVVLDDCHRNVDLIAQIYRKRRQLTGLGIVFISTTLDKNARQARSEQYVDVTEALARDDRHFDLDRMIGQKMFRKVTGIVEQRRSFREAARSEVLDIGDMKMVVDGCAHNLVCLAAALEVWDGKTPLSALTRDKSSEVIRTRIFHPDFLKQNERELLLKLAAVARFEVRSELPPETSDEGLTLRRTGLVQLDRSQLVAFAHSEIAKLIIQAYHSGPENRQLHRNLDDFTADLLKEYLAAFHTPPRCLGELLLALADKKPRSILLPLLRDTALESQIISYFRQSAGIDEAIEFLFKVKHFLTRDNVHRFVTKILFEAQSLFDSLQRTSSRLLLWTKAVKTAHYGFREDSEGVLAALTDDQFRQLVDATDFYLITYCAFSLSEVSRFAAGKLISAATDTDLVAKAAVSSADEILRGLSHLTRVDNRKARTVFRGLGNLPNNPLLRLADLPLDQFAEAFVVFNRVDEDAAKHLFDQIPIKVLVERAEGTSAKRVTLALSLLKDAHPFGAARILKALTDSPSRRHIEPRSLDSAGNALAELNKVDHKTAAQLASNYPASELANWAGSAQLVQLGKTFSEMAKINAKLARDALRKFGHAGLLSKFRNCSDVKTFTKALSEIHSFDCEMARDILDGFDDGSLSVRFKGTGVEGLGRSLREIALVSRGTANRIAAKLDVQSILGDLKHVSLVQIGHSLTEINKVDPLLARKLYAELPILMLVRMAKESGVDFQRVCNIVSQLGAVEGSSGAGRTRALVKEIGTDYFVRSAQSVRFAELCAGLFDLSKCDERLGRDVLNAMRFRVLEAKARREQFEKFCPALHKLRLIDKSTACTLFDRLKGEELTGRASNLRLDKLAECLHNLADINSDYAREIALGVGINVLRVRLNQLAPKARPQALGKLRKVLPEF
jgi:hypothetical protein